MKKFFLFLFILVSAGELVSHFADLEFLHHLCKPLIMVFLGLYYASSVSKSDRSILVILAVLFSFFGDSFLMYENLNEIYFLLGLGSFLLAHLCYTVAYRQHTYDLEGEKIHGVQKIRMAFPVVLAGTGLVVVLYPRLGELRFPVIVYAGVLILMVLAALFRFHKTNWRSYWMVFIGAVLFMISDSLLAINRFLEPLPSAGVLVMITYIGAQFLIIQGLIDHTQKRTESS